MSGPAFGQNTQDDDDILIIGLFTLAAWSPVVSNNMVTPVSRRM